MNQIPHPDACPECGRPSLHVNDEPHCANTDCENYGEVIA